MDHRGDGKNFLKKPAPFVKDEQHVPGFGGDDAEVFIKKLSEQNEHLRQQLQVLFGPLAFFVTLLVLFAKVGFSV